MAGHSKWKNIQHRKNAQDAKRGKLFQKLSKEIYVAAKQGEPNPDTNPGLRMAIDKARANSMPKDNIDRAIQKAAGNQGGENYDEIVYEGYGPSGIAIMVHCLTDNKNRTASNVRSTFTKRGGNLGESGSVSYMFDRKGLLVFETEQYPSLEEDEIMLAALDAGADDVEVTEESVEIITDPSAFAQVRSAFVALGVEEFVTSEITLIPSMTTEVTDEIREKVETLIDFLEDDDDVQEVYHNMST